MQNKRTENASLGQRCKIRERECLFRPGMTSKIADMVSRCETCIQSRRKQQREPFIPMPPATHAWSRVACDLFHMNRRDFLLIVDYFTSYPEVTLLTETTSSAIIAHTKSIFARHGLPDTVITNNGPQFTSPEYGDFAKQWEFKHATSSPLHSRANGKVEYTVQTIKGILKKATRSGEDPYLTLLNFRACSAPGGTPSPAMLLMNRNVKTRIPEFNEQEISTRSLK